MRYTIFILYLSLFHLFGYGQSYKFFTADKELSSSLINQLYQDHYGMIWIATENGLNRYDGVKFTIYRNEKGNPHSLSHNYVRSVCEDDRGNLLIGTYKGIQKYDPATDSFTDCAVFPNGNYFESNVISLLERYDHEIWVSGNQLVRITVNDTLLTAHELKLPVPTRMVDVITEDTQHTLWMYKTSHGIYRLDTDGNNKYYPQSECGTVTAIHTDNQNNVYIGTMANGIMKYDRQSDTFQSIPYKGRTDLSIKTIYADTPYSLLIGTDGQGIKRLDIVTHNISDYAFDNNFFDSNTAKVHSILKDKAGNLWIGVYQKGVIMIPAQPNNFRYMGHKSVGKNLIGSDCITSIFKGNDNMLWVGTDNDGIYRITPTGESMHYTDTDIPRNIMGLYNDSQKQLWIASYINGMKRMDTRTGSITPIQLTDINGNEVQSVYTFAEDRQGRLWIATMGGNLFYYDLNKQSIHRPDALISQINNYIDCLYYSTDNKLYAGTYNGVSCINLDTPDLNATTFLEQHIVYSLYEDTKGNIWVGCADGLYCYTPEKGITATYTTTNGLPDNTICSIREDHQENLWISTASGLSQFDMRNNKFINYYVDDGLQGNEFCKNASFADKEGNLWFGGINGITWFNPQEIIKPHKQWDVRITDFYLHNQPVRKGTLSGGKEIINNPVFEATHFELSHNDNTFSIEFSTNEFNTPGHITFLYAMNNDNWISLPQGVYKVSFANLTPDTYHFRLMAQDNDINSNVREITIHIRTPWWSSWWAKIFYCLSILGIAVLIIMQIRHRYRVREEMQQHIHAEEINEAKLQFFINISHEIRTPMSLIIAPLQKLIATDSDYTRQKNYRIIYRNAERILRLVNQLLTIRKIDKGQMSLIFQEIDIVGFIYDLCNTFSHQAQIRHIALNFNHNLLETQPLWIDPEHFDKIIVNLLSNAFKFTPDGGNVTVNLATGHNPETIGPLCHYAEITVADSGIGISETEKTHIFERFYQIKNNSDTSNSGTGIGLHLTRSLVELHHGTISAENNANNMPGCRFIVRIPLGNDHLQETEIRTEQATYHSSHTPIIPDTEEAKEQKQQPAKTKYHILLVEDDDEIRNYLSSELSTDYHIIESTNGKKAFDVIFKKVPDLIISDVMMPEMDGMTFCRKLKQNINFNHIPVILLTAKVREEDNIEGLETGADAYLTKPFSIEILRKTVMNLIQNRKKLYNTFSGSQIQKEKLKTIKAKSPDDKLMDRVMKVINDNISNPDLTVEFLAAEVGLSRVHLHRKMKELTNQTTRDFIRNVRLHQASKLLIEKHYSITEVAQLTGFNHANNFSTAFNDMYGMSPTAYMEKHLQEKRKNENDIHY